MKIAIPYGKAAISADVPDDVVTVAPKKLAPPPPLKALLEESMASPIGTRPLKEIARGKRTAAIVINDVTRPTPSEVLCEAAVAALEEGGIRRENICFVVGTGTHRGCTARELESMIGPRLLREYGVYNHDCQDGDSLVSLGKTAAGTPVVINRRVYEADVKVLTGTIVPHQTAGFSGGRKSLAVGVAGFETIRATHSPPIRHVEPMMGRIEGNRFDAELFEIARRAGVDFIINVVEGPGMQAMGVVCGDMVKAWYRGVEAASDIWTCPVSEKADIAIVSPGGHPRDVNLYQAQKAMSAGEVVVRPGGVIIVVCECSDGLATGRFARILRDAPGPERIVADFIERGYEAEESSKAFLFARALSRYAVFVVSGGVSREDLESMFMKKAETVEIALREAVALIGKRDPRIVFLPYASEVAPVPRSSVGCRP